MQESATLNSTWLRNRVAELRLKQWWLAEQVGVDKKTVVRWLHGHVRSIRIDNAKALADVLACRVEDFALQDERAELASQADQAQAATLLASGVLIGKFGPVGDWDVIETLTKAAIVPRLPAHVLATLYNQLCVACWRQSKLEEAQRYNDAALELAQRCADKAQIGAALQSRANLLHWRGDCAQAQRTYRECLSMAPYLDETALANTHSNLGASLYESGELEEGRAEVLRALAMLRLRGTPMQLSIARAHLAIIALRADDAAGALEHIEWSRVHAEQSGYRRGLAMAALMQADADARIARTSEALDHLAQGLRQFADLKIEEGLNEEFAARVWRLAGRHEDAGRAIERGLAWSASIPLERAQLLVEQSRLHLALSDAAGARRSLDAASRVFASCGAQRMVQACHRMSLDAAAGKP